MKGLLFSAIIMISSFVLQAQKTITGKIIDKQTGSALAGASIRIKGSTKGSSTNNEGMFTIQAQPQDILLITSIGYSPKSVPVPEGSSINIPLEALSAELTQLVFVGARGA